MRRAAVVAGFTLLEVLMALAVFAILSMLAMRVLDSIVDLGGVVGERGTALADVQRALAIVERDVVQMVRRPVRDEMGDAAAAIAIGDGALIEFTRQGWHNPLGKQRTTLQRVAYEQREDTLTRLFWPALDRAPGAEPVAQVLLRGVIEAEFVAYDDEEGTDRFWPPADADESGVDLAAVELRLETETFGRLARLWPVPGDPAFLARREAERQESPLDATVEEEEE